MVDEPVEIDPEDQVYTDRVEMMEYEETPQDMLADDEIDGGEEGFLRGYFEERDSHFPSEEIGLELPSEEEDRT